MGIIEESQRRRTFAIISHPDAGKTTITEKILYNGGIIREAGEVKGKAGKKAATSDWMAMEKERGVSITSSVMQFDYEGLRVNLLDTPGHKDFSEDTYRTLIAADSAAMLIDSAKGVEVQTRKLYEVCSYRKIPIFTFANKMDRDGIDPLNLIDDVENTLGIECYPVTWPIGMGDRFKGLYHRLEKKFYFFERNQEEPFIISDAQWDNQEAKARINDDEVYGKFSEDIELLEGALEPFNEERFLKGELSPLTFGSAKFDWGVDLFLQLFRKWSPSPQPRISINGDEISPQGKEFSGFVFKVQANMDKKHRDRVAFVRVCSGKFERGMKVKHHRLKRDLRLAYANQFLAQDRETVDEAFAGDVVGITDTGNFQIGDSIYGGKKEVCFEPLPRFSPEVFAKLNIKDPLKRKQLQKALKQLSEEGALQLFYDPVVGEQDPIVGVVGELQLEVLLHRLNEEYKLDAKLDKQMYTVARWPRDKDSHELVEDIKGNNRKFIDQNQQPVILLAKEWDLNWLIKENPNLEFSMTGA